MRRGTPLLLAIVIAAGCGESKSDRLTRQQYSDKADAICTKYKQKTNALSRPATLSDLADVADQVLPLLRKARGELRALRPPQDELTKANAWLAQFDVIIDDVQKIRDKAKQNDRTGVQAAATPALEHNQHANVLAAQLGMKVCSKD